MIPSDVPTRLYVKRVRGEPLHRYTNKFAGRHNIRPLDTIDMMRGVVSNMWGKQLTHSCLIKNGVRPNKIRKMSK